MTMSNPDQLQQDPERAILDVLDFTLQQTIFAIFAAYPEILQHAYSCQNEGMPAQAWIADIIYEQASALQHTLERYRQAIEVAHQIR